MRLEKVPKFFVFCAVACCLYALILLAFYGYSKKPRNLMMPFQNDSVLRLIPPEDSARIHFLKDRNDDKLNVKSEEKIQESYKDCTIPGIRGVYSEPLKPGCKMKHISIAEAVEQHHARTLSTCNNICPMNDPLCNVSTREQWNRLDVNEIQFVPFVKQGQYIFPWEKDYLSQPPLHDPKMLPSLKLSVVTIDNKRFDSDTVSCGPGDTVSGKIYLRDSYGKQRTMGGDEVRVWITSPKGYAAAGSVKDIKNGTYDFSFRCIWSGYSKLNVAVTYPREFLRTVLQHSLAGVTLYQIGLFRKGNISEVTICSPIPNVPSRPCVCNITFFQRFPFYCGRPKDSRLTCDDWKGATFINTPKAHGVTPAEAALIKQASGSALKNAIHHNIRVFVDKNKGHLPVLEACNKLNANMTWNAKSPHGYFSPGYKWNSLQCRRPQLTTNFTTQCLRNTTVMFFGDSNTRYMYNALSNFVKCKKIGKTGWPSISRCRNEEDDISISVCAHEYPLLYHIDFTRIPEYKDTPTQIDAIPSSRKHIIIIHYYLHYSYYHYSALTARIDAIQEALIRLFKRNPNVFVGIRGPHISTNINNFNHALGGDSLAPFYKKFLAEKFHSQRDRVFFLDGWDMSIASENDGFHVHVKIQSEIMLTMMAHYCP